MALGDPTLWLSTSFVKVGCSREFASLKEPAY